MSLLDEVRQAKGLHKADLLSRPNVVGVGVGYKSTAGRSSDELSLVVLVRHKVAPASLFPEQAIPKEVANIRTDVVEVGDLRPQVLNTERWRPAPGGVSVGHYKITAGTLGCAVYDRKSGARLILSNNHVLADNNQAALGDPILQPGPIDGGQPGRDQIARLERFLPIRFNNEPATCSLARGYASLGNLLARALRSPHLFQVQRYRPSAQNLVDAAVARPLVENAILDENLEVGCVSGVTPAALGMSVRKSGRTTAYTSGAILLLDATVTITYDQQRTATFENQIMTTAMSQGGDSGSLLVAGQEPKAVGLLFAGSNQATLFNPIQEVLDSLEVQFVDHASQPKLARRAAAGKAQAVKDAYQELLLSKKNVVGVGVGLRHRGGRRTDEVGLVVLVQHKMPKALLDRRDVIPSEIEGIPVDVKEVGEIASTLALPR